MYQSFHGINNPNNSDDVKYYNSPSHHEAELSYQYQNSSLPAANNSFNDDTKMNEINVNINHGRSCIPFALIAGAVLFIILLPGIVINNTKSSIIGNLNMVSSTSISTASSSSSSKIPPPSSTYTIFSTVTSPGYESSPLASLNLLPWDAIAEAARPQILSISTVEINGMEVDIKPYTNSIVWTIPGKSKSGTYGDSKFSKASQNSKESIDILLHGNDQTFQVDATGVRRCSVSITLPRSMMANVGNSNNDEISSTTSLISKAKQAVPSSSDNENIRVDEKKVDESFVTLTQEFTMAIKYVRRELRSLTESDRLQFLNALHSLYTVSASDGKSKYGSKFNTAEYFVYKHLNGAGTSDCDHWHDGAGIVTHHVAFTLEVEQALQAINLAVAMPYWEYSMDSNLYEAWADSPIFGKDWLGEASPSNDDHVIQDGGMWEGVQMPDGHAYQAADFWSMKETGSLNPFVNALGVLRSPWNNNPNQAIGRSKTTYSKVVYSDMPTCKAMYNCFNSKSTSDMNDCLNGGTHGPVHIMIGGTWNEGDVFNDENDSKYSVLTKVHSAAKILYFKILWRMGFTRCPTTCSSDDDDCKCAVPQEYIDKYGAYYILEKANIVYSVGDALTDADDDVYLKLLRALEDPGYAGEMFSSAAAFDPTFWPLHGSMERLLGLKRILLSQGDITDFDSTWGFKEYDKSTTAAYLAGDCDWSNVSSSDDLTLPTCTMGVTCFGHNEDDLLEFSGFLTSGSGSSGTTGSGSNTEEEEEIDVYTNIEFLNFIHPWNEDLPYTYDAFDYDYCYDSDGYDFYATSTTTATATRTTNKATSTTALTSEEDKLIPSSSTTATAPTTATSTVTTSTTATSTITSTAKKTAKSGRYTYKGFAPGQSQPLVKRVHMSAAEARLLNVQPIAITEQWSAAYRSKTKFV